MYDRIEDRYNDAVWMYQGAIEEGMIKGEASKAYSIAKNMKAERLPADMIARMTGLSIKDINSICLN
jgi:predicted transposase/invertase (TIGR01784 family)